MAPPKGHTPPWNPRITNMDTQEIPLIVLLLKAETPERHEYHAVLSTIQAYTFRLRDVFQDEETRDDILLHVDRVLPRLQRVFETMKSISLHGDVPENLFQGIVSPLLDPEIGILSLDQAFHLAGAALPVLLNKPSPSPYLHYVADMVLGFEGLLEMLIAHGAYSTALLDWLSSKRNFLGDLHVLTITQTLFHMCDICPADHSITATSEKWHNARSLMDSLKSLVASIQKDEKENMEPARNLPLSNMKPLSRDDKKKGRPRRDTGPTFQIPDDILQKMTMLNLPKPGSRHALSIALEVLEKEIPSFMQAALETFPCRFCWERLTGTLTTQAHPSTASGWTVNANTNYDIFGRRVGLWKVLLSDRALKSSRKLARTGAFDRVEQKLRQLASGEWRGKDLSNRLGSKKQRQAMKVSVLEAVITQNLSLLWQIDIGFYDDMPWIRQHIVKIWDIVTQDEIANALDQIITIQASYPEEIIKLSRERPMQQSDGRFLPGRFDNVENTKGRSLVPANASKTSNQLFIEMSNKFYNLTEPFLASILEATGREEFPFDLSPEELRVVRHFNTSSLILGRSGTGKTTCLVFKILAKYRTRQSIPDERPVRQLLLTRSSYLASKLQAYAKSLIETQFRKSSAEGTGDSDGQKPASLLTMEDADFPFVCTYDDFLGILDSTVKRADRKVFFSGDGKSSYGQGGNTGQLGLLDRGKRVIDFNVFKIEYWGCLSGMVPSCPPELLFSEIMGVIKGSSSSAMTLECLSREQYVSRSGKLSPAFATEAERDRVYTAFERYEKSKKQRDEQDDLDRVTGLLKVLKKDPTLEQNVHQCFEEIYVDEVQDLRCLDIALLLNCVCDARGIHLAGDTAQCISKDSVFRFPEIKALFYEYYDFIGDQTGQPELARPTQFALTKNYRSHQGILSLASFVMQMLWTGFPDTIDNLDPEIGQTGGPTPIVFAGFDSSILSAKMIGLVKLNDRIGDFGAEQVILVRDEASKDKLQKHIGEVALVLTILESKGMEFDDVLAYDFFSGSDLKSSHRCLGLLARGERKQFDSQKHAALCSELKHLYVAITRARNQLWFVESNENSVKPVLEAFNTGSVELVDTVRQKDPDVAEKVKVLRAGGSIDPDRWFKRAAHLLHQKSYADALFCYKKAKGKKGITQCQAWLYEQQGRACRACGDLQGFQENYEKAVDHFLEINLMTEATDCLEALEQYERIARLWKSRGQLPRAAVYFEKGGLFCDASECYDQDDNFEEAVDVLRRGDEFDHLIDYITEHLDCLRHTTIRRYSRLCNILLRQGRVSPELRAKTIDLLGSDVEKEAFFQEFEMSDQLCSFYESRKKYRDLYDLHLSTGDLCAALNIAISKLDDANIDDVENIFNYVVAEECFARKGFCPLRSERDDAMKKGFRSFLMDRVSHWRPTFSLLSFFEDESRPANFSRSEEGLAKDFMSLFAIAFEQDFVARSKIATLPVDVFLRAIKLLYDFTSERRTSDKSLHLLCGLYEVPGVSKKIILPWSPLRSFLSEEVDSLSPEDIAHHAKGWILAQFSGAVSLFHETAIDAWKKELHPRCVHFLIRGSCRQQRENKCSFVHEKSDVEYCSNKIAELLKICTVFARLTPFYYRRVMNEEFNSQFLGRKRRWLERLIEELTFAASIEQAAISIHTAKFHILKNPNFSAVAFSIEELLFYRLGKEWHVRQSLSMQLEQVQLAQFLGFQTNARLFRALTWKVKDNLRRYLFGNNLDIAFRAVRSAEHLRLAAAKHNAHEFCNEVRAFLESVEQSSVTSLSAFGSLASVFEYAATFLLCIINPSKAVALPWSWDINRLSAILQSWDAIAEGVTEQEKLMYASCILHLTSVFAKIVDKLEWEVRYRDMRLDCAGRHGIPVAIIRRRNADLLTTVIVNLMHWPNKLRGLSELWDKIHKVLAFSMAPGFPNQIDHRNLRETFIRSFGVYGGKDYMTILSLDNSDVCPAFLKDFVKNGARLTKLEAILKATHGIVEASAPEDGDKTGDAGEYTGRELEFMISLQRRWRRLMPRIQEQRQLRKTGEGAMFLSLQDFCFTKLGTEVARGISAKEKIALRAFLFTDGLDLLIELERMHGNIQKLREIFKLKFASPASISQLEELAVIPAQFLHFELKLRTLRHVWSVKGLEQPNFLLPPVELRLRAREAQRAVKNLKQEISVVETKLSV